MCLARGGVGGEGVEWMRFGLYQSCSTGGVLDVCLCFGCGSVGGVSGEWVGGLDQGLGWCYVCVRCESGFSVYMAGLGICVLCLADTCASDVHPVFNPVAPYGYLLPNMNLFIVDITHPESFV